jgi:hypothetical protein
MQKFFQTADEKAICSPSTAAAYDSNIALTKAVSSAADRALTACAAVPDQRDIAIQARQMAQSQLAAVSGGKAQLAQMCK